MEANALPINVDNLRATGRLAEKQVNVALEQAELNGEVIPQEVMNFINIFQDEATRKAVLEAPDKAALQKILNDSGVPMTEEDVDGFLAALGAAGKKLAESDGKLTEEELEQISGGGIGSWFKKAWNWCTSTTVGKIVTGVVICVAMGALLGSGIGAGIAATSLSVAGGGSIGWGAAVGAGMGAVLGGVVSGIVAGVCVATGNVS